MPPNTWTQMESERQAIIRLFPMCSQLRLGVEMLVVGQQAVENLARYQLSRPGRCNRAGQAARRFRARSDDQRATARQRLRCGRIEGDAELGCHAGKRAKAEKIPATDRHKSTPGKCRIDSMRRCRCVDAYSSVNLRQPPPLSRLCRYAHAARG